MSVRDLLLSCSFMFFTSLAFSQTNLNWNITGAGARAEGLGGAFIGVADDATAIVWNPAGLTQLERAELSAVGRYSSEKSESKSNVPGYEYDESNSQSHFSFNFASGAVPFKAGTNNIVVALAYQTQLDFYSKGKKETYEFESNGAASTVTPGIAFRLGPMFSIGAATNIWLGSSEYTERGLGPGSTVLYTYKEEPSFSGVNFGFGALVDFGGLAKPIPLKLGASIKTPFTLKVDADYSLSDPTGTPYTGSLSQEVEMPLMVGFGASYRIGENFTLAADYEMRLFKDKKITSSLSDTSYSGLLSASNENLNQVRIGGEYLIVTSGGVIPLRAGYRTVPTVLANYKWDRDSLKYHPDNQVGGMGFSVGTGFISNNFSLDFAYSREKYDEQKWTDMELTDFTGNYSVDRFSLSLIVYF